MEVRRLPLLLFVSYLSCCMTYAQQGYYLVQSIATYNLPMYSALTTIPFEEDTISDAERIFSFLDQLKVNGVEYEPLWFDVNNLHIHKEVATIAHRHSIDLWESDWRLIDKINQHAFGTFPKEYQAWGMEKNGAIIQLKDSIGNPMIDMLNPKSLEWLLDTLVENSYGSFLIKLRNYINGYLFDETKLIYRYEWTNRTRPMYYLLPVYSPSVLKQWKDFCKEHSVTFQNAIVDKFPVHTVSMVENNDTMKMYIPGYNENINLQSGETFRTLSIDSQVWQAWYNFLCTTFTNSWLRPFASFIQEIFNSTENWKGIAYFQLLQWELEYSDSLLRGIIIPAQYSGGIWSHSVGVDIIKIAKETNINYIICETYPPLTEFHNKCITIVKTVSTNFHKKFGIMVHRNDYEFLNDTEETKRWIVINDSSPDIIVRYPIPTVQKVLIHRKYSRTEFVLTESELKFIKSLESYRNNEAIMER